MTQRGEDGAATAQTVSRSVLFADISDSTRLYKQLGNEAGRRLLLECLETMKQVVERCGGTIVDRIGDELMCTFADPAAAGRSSCELHRAIEAAKLHSPATPSIRIGFHHGPILVDEDGVYGDTVHVAKRVESLAKPQQTLTTRQAGDLIPLQAQLATRFVDRTHLKGSVESFDLFEIVWDVGAATVTSQDSGPITERLPAMRELVLGSGGQTYTLDSTHPTLSIGRDRRADVVVDHANVSRLHARIEYRKDHFVFVDQSTNGSQVVEEGEPPRFIRRDECPLANAGTIVLGPDAPELRFPSLRYRLAWKGEAG